MTHSIDQRNASVSRSTVWTAALFVAVLLLTSCDILDGGEDEFIIRVDSIVAPQFIGPTDTLRARFHGWVGASGCFWVDHVQRERDTTSITLRFHGKRSGGTCTAMPVALDHVEVIPPPFSAAFTLKARQPQGAAHERTVLIQ